MTTLTETAVLTGRSLRHILRSPDTIITTAAMPIASMVLFVYVFGGAIAHPEGSYVSYVLPGVLVTTGIMGVAYTSYRLFLDLSGGIVSRLRSLPIARSSVLWAHALTSLVSVMVSMALVVVVALIMGFRTAVNPLAWLAVVGILALFSLALTWLAVIAGLTATSVDGASAFSYPLLLLPMVSSAFVPVQTMPGPVRWFAQHQPVTAIIDALRALLSARPIGSDLWVALGWCGATLVIAFSVATYLYRRRVG